MADKICGIVGGLGPEATLDLFRKILKNTPAQTDQDHIPLIIFCNPKIPSRYKAILEKGESPLTRLIEAVKKLEFAGAEFIAIACNLAHYWYDELIKVTKLPILHIVKETIEFVSANHNVKKVGFLAPSPTLTIGLYVNELRDAKYEVITLDTDATKRLIDEAIYSPRGIKAGYLVENVPKILEAIEILIGKGAEIVILGCTELPLILDFLPEPIKRKVVDPTDVLAKKIVRISKNL